MDYGIEKVLPNSAVENIVDNKITPNFSQEQYYQGSDEAIDGTGNYLSSSTALETTDSPSSSLIAHTEPKLAAYSSVLEPVDLYFRSGESDYIRTAETEKFLQSALTYLAANRGKKLAITGHSDNVSSTAVSLKLAR